MSGPSVGWAIPVSQVLGTIWENWARIPQITCKDTWKVFQSLQIFILNQMRPYSSLRPFLGWLIPISQAQGQLSKQALSIGAIWRNLAWIPQIMQRDTWKVIQSLQLRISHHFFLNLPSFIILTYGVLNVLSRMGSINSFGQVVPEILTNSYLSNFEYLEISGFFPHFLEVHMGKIFLKQSPLFRSLNANI